MKPVLLTALAVARPTLRLNQRDALSFILENFKMRPATRALYKKVFAHASVKERRFSLERLKDVLEEDPDRVNQRFEKHAVKLSAESLKAALKQSKMHPRRLDFLAVSTCTGYLCPGLGARLVEACGLRPDIRYADVVGMGCGSAVPALEQASNFIKANPGAVTASVSTEICSAAMFSDDSADLVVSNAIFGDGSAAVILKDSGPGLARFHSFGTLTVPQWREGLRFVMQKGRLRNVLHKDVPAQAGKAVPRLADQILSKSGFSRADVRHWILHAGGARVIDSVRDGLGLKESEVRSARSVLARLGNLSSPSVLYGLRNVLDRKKSPRKGDLGFILAFGAGFSAHGCLLEF